VSQYCADAERCPKCGVPAGSACQTQGGKVAAKDHTARFVLVPALRELLNVTTPAAFTDDAVASGTPSPG
jgi:hypothetical protein